MEYDRYQNVLIGSGEGGEYLAWHLAESGQRTMAIERRWIGGSCPNINCLLTKNEIWSAKVADLVRHGSQFVVNTQRHISRHGGGNESKAGHDPVPADIRGSPELWVYHRFRLRENTARFWCVPGSIWLDNPFHRSRASSLAQKCHLVYPYNAGAILDMARLYAMNGGNPASN